MTKARGAGSGSFARECPDNSRQMQNALAALNISILRDVGLDFIVTGIRRAESTATCIFLQPGTDGHLMQFSVLHAGLLENPGHDRRSIQTCEAP
ncbi:hypothetical protein GCM10011488_52180 [Steroidobacter agaridevorans]|nr:hypothetical protein GCM10011488_52180 [Steroidobacter agaridevorans]